MKRTDADEHSSNEFQDENLPTTAGTLIEETWLNAVQEELAHAIEYQYGALSASDDYQLNDVVQYAISDYLYSDTTADLGSFHPRMEASGQTTYVEQTAGRTGRLWGGPIWLENNGRVYRVAITDEKVTAAGLDSYTYPASQTTYVAVKISDGYTLETNTGTPTAGFVNFFKVVTDGSNITAAESIHPAWPEVYANGVRIMEVDEDKFTGGIDDVEGMRIYGEEGTFFQHNIIHFQFMEGTTARSRPLKLEQVDTTDAGLTTTYGGLETRPHDDSASLLAVDYRKLRTHSGTSEEQTHAYIEHTGVVDQAGNGDAYINMGQPAASGDVWSYKWRAVAVDAGDVTSIYTRESKFTAYKTGSNVSKRADFGADTDDGASAGVAIVAEEVSDVVRLKVTVSDTNTYRVTAYWSILQNSVNS